MDYNFAYLPFVLGLLVVAWFVLAEFLKGESVQEHISKMPKSPPARYPWDDTPWDSDGIDHDHNLKNKSESNHLMDLGDGTYAHTGKTYEETEVAEAIDSSSTPLEFHEKLSKNLDSKKGKDKPWNLQV